MLERKAKRVVSQYERGYILFISNLQQQIMKKETFFWFETMVISEDFIHFVGICDSYVWKYLANCFEKIAFVNSDKGKHRDHQMKWWQVSFV